MDAFEQAKNFIDKHNSFLLASHARTDGDDLGSILALTIALRSMGKKAVPLAKGGVPASLKFMPKQNEVLEDVPEDGFGALILSGCCDITRTGIDKLIKGGYEILNIDHHQDNILFGDVNLVDKTKSSVAELVFQFLKNSGMNIDADIAKCLLTGIFTDTGSFMHPNTNASALNAAGELMKYGARTDNIGKSVNVKKDLSTFQAWGRALENTKMDPNNGMVVSVISEEDINGIGQISDDTFSGFADMLITIPEAKFSMFVKQEGEKIKGSIRSDEHKHVDVFKIARLMGGGGHKLASGFTINGKIKKTAGGWQVVAS